MDVVGTYCHHAEPGLRPLDIRDQAACERLVGEVRPTHALLAAAATHVDGCEEDPAWCEAVNVEGVRWIAAAAKDVGAWLVFFSTDHVFGDSERAWREDDRVAPVNLYAHAKVRAEAVVRETLPARHLIVRTSWVYGRDPRGKNFVLSLVRRLRAGETVTVAEDQWGSPTFTRDLAGAVATLLRRGAGGTFHVVGPAWITRHAFAREACATFALDPLALRAVPTVALGQVAPRPRRCRLDTAKLVGETGYRLRPPDEGLRALRDEDAAGDTRVAGPGAAAGG